MPDVFRARIKAAQRDLIADCGTIRRVEERFSYSKSQIGRWADLKAPDLMPLDAVRQLEEDCGVPHVTAIMAEVTGRRLTDPEGERQAAVDLMKSHSDVMTGFAEMSLQLATAFADGEITPTEAQIADRAAATVEETMRCLRTALAVVKVRGGVKAGLRIVGGEG